MSERVVLTPSEDGWIVESLFRGVPHNRNLCPGCSGDSVMRTAVVNLVYSFMPCECDAVPYTHLVERLWHPLCYAATTDLFPEVALATNPEATIEREARLQAALMALYEAVGAAPAVKETPRQRKVLKAWQEARAALTTPEADHE